ncbi:hypothetical protein [Mangrovibacterium diazotrophicum]|uniref:Lipoprotein n=1 Tax=Mangrovibacterium diazotrophicum TaxID=1261403 RepID=A0A419W2Z9_9BACT|nr:hypothetical protein [Mangrovibacterium diazotrophicum]RKD89852.1 hypothetical protein BC643_0185 [Mangrovibacterium diazotrophicum]
MKKMISLFLFAIISLTACEKEEENTINNSLYDYGFQFSVFNAQNEDLLDPEVTGHFDASQIKIWYVANGEITEAISSNHANPRSSRVVKHENEYQLGVVLNHYKTTSITFIEWDENDTDTIVATFDKLPNGIRKTCLWYNGVEIWRRPTLDAAYYIVRK